MTEVNDSVETAVPVQLTWQARHREAVRDRGRIVAPTTRRHRLCVLQTDRSESAQMLKCLDTYVRRKRTQVQAVPLF